MKDFTKGVIVSVAVAVLCREFYAKGYNKALKWVNDVTEIRKDCLKGEGES